MRRREFIALVGSAAVGWPLAARAQQPSGTRRVGLLINASEVDAETHQRMTELQQALQQLGWSSGQNIHIDSKYSGADPSRLPQLAKELVALNPDVIVAHTTPAVVALQKDTSTIPIVFVNVSDPIGSGFVASLPRPGRNITGVMLYEGQHHRQMARYAQGNCAKLGANRAYGQS